MIQLKNIKFPTLDRADYKTQLIPLQFSLMKYQQGLFQTGKRAVLVFEGTDAAGKGGAIRRMVEHMDPRGFRVYPIGAPTTKEMRQHYLQRFWKRLPHDGQLAIFDRSWYGRVLAERVEHSISEAQWRRAYEEITAFEQTLIDDGVIFIKFFLHIDNAEQKQRFIKRYKSPEKKWKLTMADLNSRQYWDDYQRAYEDMLTHTSTESSPWQVIPANNKNYARIAVLRKVLEAFEKTINLNDVVLMTEEVEEKAKVMLGV